MQKGNKITEVFRSSRAVYLCPGNAIGNYETHGISLITDKKGYEEIFPSSITEFTMIGKCEYDVIKKYFPTPQEDSNGVRCLIPVEEHLADGITPPDPHIVMKFTDNEMFSKYIGDTSIEIIGAQFCPVENEYREPISIAGTDYIPLGSMNIVCSWKYFKQPFQISQLICKREDVDSYIFTKVYQIDTFFQAMLVHLGQYFCSNLTSDFHDDLYALFKDIIPCVSREAMRLWDGIQWMLLHPKLKEVFFREEAPAPEHYRKPIKSGIDLRRVRNNVKYIHVDIPEHHRLTKNKEIKRKPLDKCIYVKGYKRFRYDKDEYVKPHKRGPKDAPLMEPVERKMCD